ncbi:13657_t:CDS:2 [Ambispora gerdemannii]|uniref:13657_t:CDS:1 n=1 Tax=Ambispora gerdemannii TaxID=144530 RepID=A0A9N9FEY1_9GLOM|nr:13657_t:CDS:2 [Ambispora gerdemannii]
MQSHTILPPIKFLLDSPNHESSNNAAVDYLSALPQSNRQSFSSASSPPITPLSSSFRLPSMSHQNKPTTTTAMSLSEIANGQNISTLLSPPKSPETSPTTTYFDHYGAHIAPVKRMSASKSLIDDQSSSSNANRYQCPYCSKRFSRPSSLRIHTYSHTGEKPFMCTEPGCGRKFSVQSNMRRHLRVHRLGRPVKKVRYDGEVEGVKVHLNPAAVSRTC